MPHVDSVDLKPMITKAADDYLDTNLEKEVAEAVDQRFTWKWDDENQILYIYTTNLDTTKPDPDEGE